MSIRSFLLICILSLPTAVQAHGLQYSVGGGQAVVIRLASEDNAPFSFENYELYRVGEKQPFQSGRSDGQGRITFLPDRAGEWRVKAFSEEGHGLDFTLTTDAASQVLMTEKPAYERYGRIVVGVPAILGLFGFLALYVRKKNT